MESLFVTVNIVDRVWS